MFLFLPLLPKWGLLPDAGKKDFGEGGSTVTCWSNVLECVRGWGLVHRSKA